VRHISIRPEVIGHERAAMVVARGNAACDPGCEGAEHADSLGGGVVIQQTWHVPPHAFGVPVVVDERQTFHPARSGFA
jgi:hypothetical protein